MPPAIWAFTILVGFALGYDLPGALVHGRNPNNHLQTSVEDEKFFLQVAQASRQTETGCKGTVTAVSTRRTPVRLQIDGKEQLLDTSWSHDWKIEMDERLSQEYAFLDPLTGQRIACRTAYGSCGQYDRYFGTLSCDPKEGEGIRDSRRSGEPRLNVRAPHFLIGNPQHGSTSMATIYVEILGEITDEWWCPEVEVLWPDRTFTKRESDCDPYTPSDTFAEQSWKFSHRLRSGQNVIRVRLYRYGEVLATENVFVTVSGEE